MESSAPIPSAPFVVDIAAPLALRMRIRALLMLLRPFHWMKSLLVILLPLLEGRTWSATGLLRLGVMLVAFILASSVIYVVNDVADRARDREHPTKRFRPIASGQVSVPAARALVAAVTGGLVAIVALLPLSLTWPVLAYLALQLTYTFRLKHVPLLDTFVVASGFVLRIVQSYVALGLAPSRWLVLAVFWASLLLALTRRRHELGWVDEAHRPALAGYSIAFIDQIASLTAGLAAVTIMLYLAVEAPIDPHRSTGMLLLAPVTVFALFRYLQMVSVGGAGGSAVKTLLRDPLMVVSGGAWCVTLLALALWSG